MFVNKLQRFLGVCLKSEKRIVFSWGHIIEYLQDVLYSAFTLRSFLLRPSHSRDFKCLNLLDL